MKSLYTEQAEVGDLINHVKDQQDRVLDKYDPKSKVINFLMKELVRLERELEELDKEYELAIKQGV